MKNRFIIPIVLIGSVFIGSALGSALAVYKQSQQEAKITQTQDSGESKDESEETQETAIEERVKTQEELTTEDGEVIGEITIGIDLTTTVSCGDEECFEKKFETCEPATLTAESSIASVYYEIIGPTYGGCEMLFKYTENPNPYWVDQPLTCTFDNTKNFETATQEALNDAFLGESEYCNGPLLDVISSN